MNEVDRAMTDLEGEDTMLFVGYARVPQGTTARGLYDVIGFALEVEASSGRVVEASCTLAVPAAEQFVRKILVGRDLSEGIGPIMKELERRFHGPTQRAVIVALKAAYERFRDVVNPHAPASEDPHERGKP